MQYKSFKDGIKLSRLGMGVMRLPVLGGDDSKIDFEKAQKLINQCMEKGINYYDWYYGDAKELYEILQKANIPIMVMEPVRGGMLANLKEEAAKEVKK